MNHIVYIEFGKSRSTKFKKLVTLAKGLPNFEEINEMYSVQINTVKEYLINQEIINEVIDIVRSWKHSTVLLYGKVYKSSWDYYSFLKELERNAGEYAIFLKNRDSVSLGAVTIESLPLPIVFYPGLYGTFFAFADDIREQIYFCECEKKAICNFFRLKKMDDDNYEENQEYLLDRDFPEVVKKLSKEEGGKLEEQIHYKKGLCFRCNKTIPKKTYCHPMYGGKFKQHYGWYINQEYYNLGIDQSLFDKMYVLPEECTPELYDTVQRINYLISEQKYPDEYYTEISELRNSIHRAIENSVREQLGFRKIGDAWVSETMLFNIVKGLYPNEEIIRHHRPQWLEGLELDIYLPNLNIGLEYQGIQHFQAIEHWGGQDQLNKQQEHDSRKKKICKELGVRLVCINYDEPMSAEYISMRIMETI